MEKKLTVRHVFKDMNKNSESIILFDSVSNLDDLPKTSKHTSKIISFDYETHKILKDKKINHETSDSYLSKNDENYPKNCIFYFRLVQC